MTQMPLTLSDLRGHFRYSNSFDWTFLRLRHYCKITPACYLSFLRCCRRLLLGLAASIHDSSMVTAQTADAMTAVN